MNPRETLTVSDSHELLQHVALLTGFELADCLVCIAFRDGYSAGAFRVRLPARRDECALPAALTGLASRFPSDTEFVLVLYARQEFPRPDLVQSIDEHFQRAGFAVREMLWQAAGRWGNYLTGTDEPYRPAHGSRPGPNLVGNAVDESSHFTVDANEVQTGLSEMPAPTPNNALVQQIERVCVGDAEAAAITAVIAALATPTLRDLVLLQFAWGEAAGQRFVSSLASGDSTHGLGVLVGCGPHSPSFARIALARTACYRLRALQLESVHAALWTIEGWLSWAVGESSHAGECFEYALALDPDYTLAQLLSAMVGSGHVPDWAFPSATVFS